MSVDHLWAGWRSEYVKRAADESRERRSGQDVPECILCALVDEGKDHYVIARNEHCFAVMNLYPYGTGHLMVVPLEHHQNLEEFSSEIRNAVMEMTNTATRILREIYKPDGMNLGVNMGEAAGAGIPGHLHMHVIPRWVGDTGSITAIANARVLPETLNDTYEKIYEKWPHEERV